MDVPELTWSAVDQAVDGFGSLPRTWDGYCRAHEWHRQIFVQRLALPEQGDWNFPIWVRLNRVLVEMGRLVQAALDRPEHEANLAACIEHCEMELRTALNPLSPEESARIGKALGFVTEDPPQDPADWWKK